MYSVDMLEAQLYVASYTMNGFVITLYIQKAVRKKLCVRARVCVFRLYLQQFVAREMGANVTWSEVPKNYNISICEPRVLKPLIYKSHTTRTTKQNVIQKHYYNHHHMHCYETELHCVTRSPLT